MPADMPSDSRAQLSAAVHADDAARADEILRLDPTLRATLNAPAPELAFGALPLFPLVDRQQRALIEVFLRHGADLDARSHWWAGGFGVLETCDPAFAPFLIERGATVGVHAASRLGLLEVLDGLLAADPTLVHARGGDGQTPLHYASSVPVAELLLDRGADLDALDVDHEGTPAQWMARDRPDVARFLVARGCRTDLLLAAALGDADRVRAYLAADPATIRTRVSEAWFPMRDPRAGGHIYLWTLGRNRTAHRVAREAGHEAVARLIEAHAPEDLGLAFAGEAGDEATCAALLARRPGLVRLLDADALRSLPAAAEDGDRAAVRCMLGAGWPVGTRGRMGETALHWAAWHGDAEMAREILRHAPPLEDRGNHYGATPLGWAVHGSEHGPRRGTGDYAGVVAVLLAAGAARPTEPAGSAAVREALGWKG